MATPSTRALVAHILRRTTFGPFPGQVDAWAKKGIPATISHVLAATPLPLSTARLAQLKEPQNGNDPVNWWVAQMANKNHGIHEKMVWFWHGHLTSSADKVNWMGMMQQHKLLRDHALGNFATLLQLVTIDAGMLWYLDGADSAFRTDPDWPSTPNENYSRELMELFGLGIGNYTQRDVENGAVGLSGWSVQWETAKPYFDAINNDLIRYDLPPVSYLGAKVARNRQVVSAVLAHKACAPWVAGKAWRFFVGTNASASRRSALARVFKTQNAYNVKPLVRAILNDPAFLSSRLNRPKMPVEFVVSAMAAAGVPLNKPWDNFQTDFLYNLGMVPFYPPSVAGWPQGDRWLAPGITMVRARFITELLGPRDDEAPAIKLVADSSNMVTTALARCSVYEVTTQTRTALNAIAAKSSLSKTDRARLMLGAVLASPEFALA